MEEVWRKIEGFDRYEMSNLCRIRDLEKNRFLKMTLKSDGYLCVCLANSDGKHILFLAHRLLAMCFIENDNRLLKIQVNHINGIRHDNRLENLEWVTPRENLSHGKLRIKNKSSKYIGVRLKKGVSLVKQWEAKIRIKGKTTYLGYYLTEYEAHLAYQKALKDHDLINKYF